MSFLLYQFNLVCVTLENAKLRARSRYCIYKKYILFFEILREEKAKSVIGNLCLTRSICFSGFDPEKSLFHTIADNSNEFLSFDGWPNALNRRYSALQNKSTLAEVFPENKALFHKSCIAAYNKQSWKQKLKENENGDRSGSCNMNLKIKKRAKKKKKEPGFQKNFERVYFLLQKRRAEKSS